MPQKSLLLTSFATWRAEQASNSADDLLSIILQRSLPASSLLLLRHLPVNVPIAFDLITDKIAQWQPDIIVCCGMAERRDRLNLESTAVVGNQSLSTTVNLALLLPQLTQTEISEDAGRFVCNGIYYAILNYLKLHTPQTQCLFVHVPPLNSSNRECIVADFSLILERLMCQ